MPVYSLCVTAVAKRFLPVRVVDIKRSLRIHASPAEYTMRINMNRFAICSIVASGGFRSENDAQNVKKL